MVMSVKLKKCWIMYKYYQRLYSNFMKLFPRQYNKICRLGSKQFSCASNTPYNRHNYDKLIESLINDQINIEFSAGYAYLNMASYYARSDVALPGCYGFFMKMYYEEQEHALKFLKYQILRGGCVNLFQVNAPGKSEWSTVSQCFGCALFMEKTVKEKIVTIHKAAEKLGDSNVADMLTEFINAQEQSIYELSRLFTRANELTTNDIGRYLFDRELHEVHVRRKPPTCIPETAEKYYT